MANGGPAAASTFQGWRNLQRFVNKDWRKSINYALAQEFHTQRALGKRRKVRH